MAWGDNVNFGSVLMAALEAGKESKRRQVRDEWEKEDRDVEKQILQHRLRELKIQESLKKREASMQNLKLLEGTPEADIPDSMAEMGDQPGGPYEPSAYAPGAIATVPDTIQRTRRFKPQEISGIPEFGLPSVSLRPDTYEQSMERQLADLVSKKRTEAMWTPQRASRGGIVTLPATGEVLAKGDPYQNPNRYTTTVERDASGRTVRKVVPIEQAVGQEQIQEPLPRQSSGAGGSRGQAADVEIEDFVQGVSSGQIPVSKIPTSALGVRIAGALTKSGFNVRSAARDEAAIKSFYGAMNGTQMNQMRLLVDETDDALGALEESVNAWDGKGLPILSSANLALVKRGAYGDVQTANDIDNTIKMITTNLASIERGGDAATDKAIAEARKALSGDWSKDRLIAAIKSLRKGLAIRGGSIRSLEPVLPSGAGQGVDVTGGARPQTGPAPGSTERPTVGSIPNGAAPGVAHTGALTPAAVAAKLKEQNRPSDPETVKKVMGSPAALKALFGIK